MVRKDLKMWIAAMILGGAVVIGLPSCDDPEVMNSLKELQEKDSISSANLEKLKTLLEKAQKKVDETEQELQKVKENQGGSNSNSGSSSVDLSEIESEISGINSQLKNWKKLLQEKIDSLGEEMPSVEGLVKTEDLDSFASKSEIPNVDDFVSKNEIQGLPSAEDLTEIQEKLYQVQWQIWEMNANGHEFVDLGLSVLWATCNVGAENPEEAGDYFAWGEVEPKTEFNEKNYKAKDWQQDLDADHDAATQNWGGKWRMPTKAELEELMSCERSENKDKKGCDVNNNGHSIFLPFAGFYLSELKMKDYFGYYWSSSCNEDGSNNMHYLSVSKDMKINTSLRYSNGFNIRPVLAK